MGKNRVSYPPSDFLSMMTMFSDVHLSNDDNMG